MKKPVTIWGCPFCEYKEELKLIIEKVKKLAKSKMYHSWFWKYKCPECDEKFTTTESDELSLKK